MKKTIFSLIFLTPITAAAFIEVSITQVDPNARTITDILYQNIVPILRMLPAILIGLAFIVFVWGIIKYILAKGEKDSKEATGVITFGIIAITVITAVWGIVYFLLGEFNIRNIPVIEKNPDRILERP